MTPTPYKPQPTTTGYYWMRWWRKHMRRWSYEIVWVSAFAPYEGVPIDIQVRGEWKKLSQYRNATFHGPLVPPKSADAPARGERGRK